jgi:hypothetical protein
LSKTSRPLTIGSNPKIDSQKAAPLAVNKLKGPSGIIRFNNAYAGNNNTHNNESLNSWSDRGSFTKRTRAITAIGGIRNKTPSEYKISEVLNNTNNNNSEAKRATTKFGEGCNSSIRFSMQISIPPHIKIENTVIDSFWLV